ncbi:hypothetical protein APR41_13735 [Salegentibacter salinarum]|uniref:Histone deacetylase n=1 Tax=Salegentibacter salinarum TaxID=447422 RepID=A0A2N0U151_9FLAO|nr:hypothetical protein [Salegentibacter salinarum]PKD20727.1 hypothetical protein APR41_13735 [Salegentibacter salinarum]SKB81686.1 hypothetical protein SAMN05660903_02688 [Salegentibacter salinarum]
MSQEEPKVWYACYGSNLLKERFSCYIGGGQPANAKRVYPGCSNKTLPEKSKGVTIHGKLYFAKSSKTWSGGGAGFIQSDFHKDIKTLGRMYLITRQQFIDLVQQEIKFEGDFNIDLETVIKNRSLDMKNNSWYGKIIYLGEDENCPIFTFTNEDYLKEEINPPHEFYLKIIIEGLKETYKMNDAEIKSYLKNKEGIKGFPIEDKIPQLIKS